MESARRFSVTLPPRVAEIVEAKIKSGAYASVSELLCEGVQALLDKASALPSPAGREKVARRSRVG
jgi:antitoxin ParD1/3/4